jgi:hypothetical protein
MNLQAGISLPNISFEIGKLPVKISLPIAADFNVLPHGDNRNIDFPLILGCVAGGLLVLCVVAKVMLDKIEKQKNNTDTKPEKIEKDNEKNV